MKNNKISKKLLVFFCTCVGLLILFGISTYDGLVTRQYTIASSNTEGTHTYVVITDLHSTYYGENQEKLVKKISEANPEAIFLIGDISEDRRPFEGTGVLLSQIANIYPCYYVTGNHERWADYTDNIKSLFEEYGVTVLDEETVDLGDEIRLHGVDDPLFFETEEDFLSAIGNFDLSEQCFDILLSHRPEYAEEYANAGFDLAVCGHAHGGQVRIPLILNGLYAPHQGFFPKYVGGSYDMGNSLVIVSRGLMIDDLPRIFNPPELLVITITGNK